VQAVFDDLRHDAGDFDDLMLVRRRIVANQGMTALSAVGGREVITRRQFFRRHQRALRTFVPGLTTPLARACGARGLLGRHPWPITRRRHRGIARIAVDLFPQALYFSLKRLHSSEQSEHKFLDGRWCLCPLFFGERCCFWSCHDAAIVPWLYWNCLNMALESHQNWLGEYPPEQLRLSFHLTRRHPQPPGECLRDPQSRTSCHSPC